MSILGQPPSKAQKEEAAKIQALQNKINDGIASLFEIHDLGEIYYKQKKYEKAVEYFNIVIEKKDNDPKVIGSWPLIYFDRGRALYFLGRTDEGIQDLYKAGSHRIQKVFAFMRKHKIDYDYDTIVSTGPRVIYSNNQRTGKNFPGRDQVFNALRDDVNNSNMSWSDKQKAKVKLHDDMYK